VSAVHPPEATSKIERAATLAQTWNSTSGSSRTTANFGRFTTSFYHGSS